MVPSVALRVSEYRLQFAGERGALQSVALPGGATSLIGPDRPMGEASLERAIEIAENWLMPHAAYLGGMALEVHDPTGRFGSQLQSVLAVSTREWTVAEVEGMFQQVVDMATGRNASSLQEHRDFVADLLLMRELAHHGRASAVLLK